MNINTVASGDLAHGSGSGRFRRGRPVKLAEIKVGDLIIIDSHAFDATNVARVTRIWPDRFYASFVEPLDPTQPRRYSHGEFCAWDFDLEGSRPREFFHAIDGAHERGATCSG